MSFQRIWALILRYYYAMRHPTRLVEFFFWPMIDIGFLGLIALWSSSLNGSVNLVRIFVTALVFWQVIYRSSYEVQSNVLDEFIESNLPNLLSSPLRRGEWIIGLMLSGMAKILLTILFGAFVGWLFFKVNVFAVGPIFIPFAFLCLLSGWMIGFVGAGIIFNTGPKLIQLPWVIATLGSILSAVFYPLEILPTWLRFLAQSFPMSYIFEGLRELLLYNSISPSFFLFSALLNLVYILLAIKFFLVMVERSRIHGLSH